LHSPVLRTDSAYEGFVTVPGSLLGAKGSLDLWKLLLCGWVNCLQGEKATFDGTLSVIIADVHSAHLYFHCHLINLSTLSQMGSG
jgi:hypothetical protein